MIGVKVFEVAGNPAELERMFRIWARERARKAANLAVTQVSLAASVPPSGETYYTLLVLFVDPEEKLDGEG